MRNNPENTKGRGGRGGGSASRLQGRYSSAAYGGDDSGASTSL